MSSEYTNTEYDFLNKLDAYELRLLIVTLCNENDINIDDEVLATVRKQPLRGEQDANNQEANGCFRPIPVSPTEYCGGCTTPDLQCDQCSKADDYEAYTKARRWFNLNL